MRNHFTTACITLLLFATAPASAKQLQNQMGGHGSAYLAMHGKDPVHWQQWNAETVALAKQENKLLYVSSGYFSCHWCHVMQQESYQNDKIAALLNRDFIPVKVDRELNPALDDRLIDFVERTQGYAGWPLNVFITPEGYPLVGMVYQPPKEFQRILESISQKWQGESMQLKELAVNTTNELNARAPVGQKPAAEQLRQRLLTESMQLADELQGGFGNQNKFPSVPQLDALLTIYESSRDSMLGDFLQLTFYMMAERGLNDHLEGGFYRYVVDPAWHVPHFEKMLYDNALLASLYLRAADVIDQPDFQQVALQTLDFMQREFQTKDGGLLASFSAIDEQGIEGGYYLWHEDEARQLLTAQEFQVVSRIWGIGGPPELEHGHHLQQAAKLDQVAGALQMSLEQTRKHMQNAQRKLLEYRRQRTLPEDSKQIAAWNGLALTAFVAGTEREPALRNTTTKLRDFILQQLWSSQNRSLKRAASGGEQLGSVGLEDYAYVARGLLDYADFAADATAREIAGELLRQAWQRYYSPAGWQLQQDPLLNYGAHQALLADGPMPSPSAVMIATTRRWLQQNPDVVLEQQLQSAVNQYVDAMHDAPFWYAGHIMQLQDK